MPDDSPEKHYDYLNDANYYRLGYQLAAQLLHLQLGGETSKAVGSETARGVAERFRDEAAEVKERLEKKKHSRRWVAWAGLGLSAPEDRLRRFLHKTVIPCLLLVIAGALRAEEEPGHAEDLVSRVRGRAHAPARPEDELSYRALYNLACYDAGAEARSHDAAVEYLRRALRKAPEDRQKELAKWACKDPSLKALQERDDFKEILEAFDPKKAEEG